MTQIKCKIQDLEEICKLAGLKGKDPRGKEYTALPDFLMSCEEKMGGISYIKIKAVDNKGAIALHLVYKNLTIIEPGLIPIGDVETFQKYLSRFNSSDEVTVSTTENRIVLTRQSPKKVAYIPKASVEALTTHKGAEKILRTFKFDAETDGYPRSSKTYLDLRLTLNADDIKSVVDDGEVVQQRIYPWKVEGNKLSIKVGSEQLGQIETDINLLKIEPQETSPASTKTSYAYGLDNIFSNISSEIKIYLANKAGEMGCPLYLEKETDKYNLTIILAPAAVGK